MAAGAPDAQQVLTAGWLAGPPSIGSDALAAAVTRLRTSTDAAMLWELAARSARVEHPVVLDAALEVAAHRAATGEARAASLLILAGLLGSGISVENPPAAPRVGTVLLTETIPSTRFCAPALRLGREDDPAAVALPSDAERQVARVLDVVRTSPDEPQRRRNLAHCLCAAADPEILPQIDVSAVRLAYVCGSRFTVHNPTALPLPLAYPVEGDAEEADLTVDPGATLPVTVETTGVVRLRYDGRVIRSTANRTLPCPR